MAAAFSSRAACSSASRSLCIPRTLTALSLNTPIARAIDPSSSRRSRHGNFGRELAASKPRHRVRHLPQRSGHPPQHDPERQQRKHKRSGHQHGIEGEQTGAAATRRASQGSPPRDLLSRSAPAPRRSQLSTARTSQHDGHRVRLARHAGRIDRFARLLEACEDARAQGLRALRESLGTPTISRHRPARSPMPPRRGRETTRAH